MKKSSVAYPFEVRPLSKEEGGGYSIYFPDLPGCWSDGTTPEDAIENGRDALQSWLAVAQEFGDGIPKPFSSVSGRFLQRVPRSLHARRHSWSSQRPAMFLRNRTVPSRPISFVKFAAIASCVVIGARVSTPTSDHVPHEM